MNSKMFILHDSEGNEIGRFVSNKTREELLEELNKMGKTQRHQDKYNYLHDNKNIPKERLHKLLNWFNRINFWDWDLKIKYRKHKDYVRGGISRVKGFKYK